MFLYLMGAGSNGATIQVIRMKQVHQNNKIELMNYIHQEVNTKESIKIHNLLPQIGIEKARLEIIAGLECEPKRISPKYFYNKEGGILFEKITKLEEYYPTRCEKEILSNVVNSLDVNV